MSTWREEFSKLADMGLFTKKPRRPDSQVQIGGAIARNRAFIYRLPLGSKQVIWQLVAHHHIAH